MKKPYLFFIIAIGITFAMQMPFLLSDPDWNIASSRDANTDEGVNTCQIRNLINHGHLTFKKSDNFVKTPVFGLILAIPFKVFGATHLVGRLTILLFSLIICMSIFCFDAYYRLFGISAFILVFFEFYIFHYFHYCMAEMPSTALIFLSIFLMVKPYKIQSHLRSGFLSATAISLAYYIKIQFLYGILILPLAILLFILFRVNDKKLLIKQLLCTLAFLILYLLIYFLLWYWPNHNFFNYVMVDQTSNRFASFPNLLHLVNLNLHYGFYNDYLTLFTYAFYILYVIGFIYCFFTKSSGFKILFISISCWILIELHKLSMTYLPTRYMISLWFSMGLLMALVFSEFVFMKGKNAPIILIKVVSILILVSFGIKNVKDYSQSYKNRAYNILKIDNYLSHYNFENKPVIGAWAPSVSWKCKAISYPVWKDYFNDVDVINTQNPAIIIAETDEEDSGQAFSSRGIVLDAYADSIKYFTINRWKLKLLWIKNPGIK